MEQVTRISAIASAALILVTGNASGAGGRTLRLIDLRQSVAIESPQISPDAKSILAVIGRGDYDKDRLVDDLVTIDVRTHAMRTLVADAHAEQFGWSPDASAIAYVGQPKSGDEKSPQLFVLSTRGGEPVQLTHEKNGVSAMDWRPDGKALAYAFTPEPKNAAAIEHHEDGFDVTGEAWTEQQPFDSTELGEVGIGGGKPRSPLGRLTTVNGGITYSADGRAIYATVTAPGTDQSQERNAIARVDRATGGVAVVRDATTAGEPLRSTDGKFLAYLSGDATFSPVQHVIVRDAAARRVLWTSARVDRNVQTAAFLPDGGIAVQANDGTHTRLFRVDARGARVLPTGELNVRSSASVARDGTIAFAASAADRPAEVYVLRPGARTPERVTSVNNWITRYALGRHESIAWHSHGMTVDGVLFYPPGYAVARRAGRKLPLVLYIHGGPTAASTTSFGFPDVLAAHGWIVFSPNYAGSDNEGVRFAGAIVPHVTSVAGPTIEDGIAAVLAHTAADPARIAVSGWSAGGMMTSWLITHDTRWRAAVDGAAVDDFLGLGNMSDSKGYLSALIGRDPYADPARMQIYREESPMTYVDRVRTPTLILSDAGDFRVPTPVSYAFYHGIRATGTPVQFVIWPVGGHFPSDPVRAEDVDRQWEAWLAAHL